MTCRRAWEVVTKESGKKVAQSESTSDLRSDADIGQGLGRLASESDACLVEMEGGQRHV
jgi:hypothetical protein